jgi:hypothetical protein
MEAEDAAIIIGTMHACAQNVIKCTVFAAKYHLWPPTPKARFRRPLWYFVSTDFSFV